MCMLVIEKLTFELHALMINYCRKQLAELPEVTIRTWKYKRGTAEYCCLGARKYVSTGTKGRELMPLARLLQLAGPLRKTLRVPLTFEETGDTNSDFRELPVPQNSIGQSLKDVQLPSGVLVLLIRRNDRFIVPRGNTRLETDDILTLMGTPDAIRESEERLASAHE